MRSKEDAFSGEKISTSESGPVRSVSLSWHATNNARSLILTLVAILSTLYASRASLGFLYKSSYIPVGVLWEEEHYPWCNPIKSLPKKGGSFVTHPDGEIPRVCAGTQTNYNN